LESIGVYLISVAPTEAIDLAMSTSEKVLRSGRNIAKAFIARGGSLPRNPNRLGRFPLEPSSSLRSAGWQGFRSSSLDHWRVYMSRRRHHEVWSVSEVKVDEASEMQGLLL